MGAIEGAFTLNVTLSSRKFKIISKSDLAINGRKQSKSSKED